MKAKYTILIGVLFLLSFVQIYFYRNFKFVQIAKNTIERATQNNQRFISANFENNFKSNNDCSETIDNLVYLQDSSYDDKVKFVFYDVLGEFAMHLTGKIEKIKGGFTIYIIVYGRRKNFELGLEFVKSENEYYLNQIHGICDFLNDVNSFIDYSSQF